MRKQIRKFMYVLCFAVLTAILLTGCSQAKKPSDTENSAKSEEAGYDEANAENTKAENTNAENTKAEDTKAESTKTENTKREDTKSDAANAAGTVSERVQETESTGKKTSDSSDSNSTVNAEPDTKSDDKSDKKSDNKSDKKSDDKSDKKSDDKSDNKSDDKSDKKSDDKSDKKSDNKSDKKSDDKSDKKSDKKDAKAEGQLAFSLQPGAYENEFTLFISAEDKKFDKATIYYTLDGSDPTASVSRMTYSAGEGISIRDRSKDKNVVSAVPTELYDAANVTMGKDRKSFITTSQNPSDEAVDKCTVVRAVAEDKKGNISDVLSGTYFIGSMAGHIEGLEESCKAAKEAGFGENLLVISITGEYDDFFGYENGIYVKGKVYDESIAAEIKAGARINEDTSRKVAANYNQKGRDWERKVHAEFFECGARGALSVISQDCGIRIQGNYSRSDLQKGFRLYARNDYGKKNFKYALFGDSLKDVNGDTIDKFKSLTLRNGGNCAFTTKFSADYWAKLCEGMAVETQASRPAIVYLNGEYWGLYVLEENYSEEYFETTYGVDKNTVVLYKGDAEALKLGYKLDLGELPEGEKSEDYYFKQLLGFFKIAGSLKKDSAYEDFCKIVDPQSVIDYFAVEIWINNKWDWPGKNWSMWRTTEVDPENPYADARWRFCFYDLEFGGVSGRGDANVNTIKEDNYKPKGLLDTDTNNPAVLCFAYMMQNEGFRNQFYERLRELSTTYFEKEHALSVLNAFGDIYGPLYEQFFNRYPGTGSKDNSLNGGYASKKCIAEFLEKREKYIESMITWSEKILAK